MTEKKNSRLNLLRQQLKNRYRLVILNDDSFAEKFSLRLSPIGLMILLGSITIVMTTLVISLVAFTPLREYIPGYGDIDERKNVLKISARTDSIQKTLSSHDWVINNMADVLEGKTEGKPTKPQKDTTGKYSSLGINPGENEREFRKQVENGQVISTNISPGKNAALSGYFFFSPISGMITTSYDLAEEHYGTDISAKENELIKATLDGTVIFSGFTAQDGYVIQIQHGNNLISVYKHCSNNLKKTGDYVKAGEPIAVVGNTGESSKGTHLHFEIWYNGIALNPEEYVSF